MVAGCENVKMARLLVPDELISLIESKLLCYSFLWNYCDFLEFLCLYIKHTHSRGVVLETEYEFVRVYFI